MDKQNICILGAGIIGLSTAYRLIELKLNANITIIADKFDVDTTSDGAGGLFRPDAKHIHNVDKNVLLKYTSDSFKYFHDLLFNSGLSDTGVQQLSGYQFFDTDQLPPIDPSYKDFIYNFRYLDQNEINRFNSNLINLDKPFKCGYFSTTLCVDTRTHMKYLTKILTENNVKFIKMKITSIELFLNENKHFDVLFNCLGLGARELFNDDKLIPVRGHMLRVNAPWIKHFYYKDVNCYIIPNTNTVCLGGTRQFNESSLTINENESKKILANCKKLCPSLENATIEWQWIGLRPYREPIRIEKEFLSFNSINKKILLIHNYGHGANGIALSRGTAIHAVDLLLNEMKTILC